MLNIDYSNKRRFLMSLGITLIFLGSLLYLGTLIFAVERTENVFDDWKIDTDNPIARDYNQNLFKTKESMLKNAQISLWFSGIIVLIGMVISFHEYNNWKDNNFKDKN